MSHSFAVPIELIADPETIYKFLSTFSRFEYSLKRSGYLKQKERAEPDWDLYANTIEGRFRHRTNEHFSKAQQYLIDHPPQIQIVVENKLDWKNSPQRSGESFERYLLRLVQTIRNNLFHGGKYPTGQKPEDGRNTELLNAGLEIIRECLTISPKVKAYFDEVP